MLKEDEIISKTKIQIFYTNNNDVSENNCNCNCKTKSCKKSCQLDEKIEENYLNIEEKIVELYGDSVEINSYDVDLIDIFKFDFARYLIEEKYRLPLVILDESLLVINGNESYKFINNELKKYISI